MFRLPTLLFALLAFSCANLLATEISFTQDAASRRVEKRVDGLRIKAWLWADELRVAAELDATNAVTARFIYAGSANVPSQMPKGTNTFRLITDPRGSVRLVVNAQTGEIVQRLDYDEWGRVTRDTNPGFQPFGFAGGLYDPETGLVRFGARDYDAQTARWTAKDPTGFEGGDANLFAYALHDPINLVDPTGAAASDAPTGRATRAPAESTGGGFSTGAGKGNREPVRELRPPSATRNPSLAETSRPLLAEDAAVTGRDLKTTELNPGAAIPSDDDGTRRNPFRCPPAKSGSTGFVRQNGTRKAIPPGPFRPPVPNARDPGSPK